MGTQDFCNDGVNICSRLSSLFNVCIITFYVAALFIPDWSETDRLGFPDDVNTAGSIRAGNRFGPQAGKAFLGLDEFCVEVPIENWGNDKHQPCFKYDDDITTCEYNTTSKDYTDCVTKKGCDRFNNVCTVRDVIKICLAIGILCCLLGATFSEKVAFLGTMQFLAALAGMVAMSFWVDWYKNDGDGVSDAELKMAAGGWLVIAGWVLAVIAGIFTCIDRCTTDSDNRHGMSNDGIMVIGRFASFAAVCIWLMLVLAVVNPEWTKVKKLGNAGGFCGNPGSAACSRRSATFGLFIYCVEEEIPYFGSDDLHYVCLEWDTELIVTGNSTNSGFGPTANNETVPCIGPACADGNTRFDSENAEDIRKFTAFATLAAFLAAVVCDIFSEKLLLSSILLLGSAVGGLCAMSAWVHFQQQLKDKSGVDDVKYSDGGWLVMGSWLLALLASILYCMNYKRKGSSGGRSHSTSRSKTNESSI